MNNSNTGCLAYYPMIMFDYRQAVLKYFSIIYCIVVTGPQVVVTVYGLNSLGKDEVRGYGSIHLPITPGRYVPNIYTCY